VRPGVVGLLGEPALAGVAPRDTAMLAAASTNDASPEVSEPSRVAEDVCAVKTVSAVFDQNCGRLRCARRSSERRIGRKKLDWRHARKQKKREKEILGVG